MKKTGIGSRKQIKLVDETPTYGSDNEPADNCLLNTWANVELKNSSKVNQFNQVVFDKFFEFRFRWVDNVQINANCKVVYNGNRLAVIGLERDQEKNFYYILRAEAKAFS